MQMRLARKCAAVVVSVMFAACGGGEKSAPAGSTPATGAPAAGRGLKIAMIAKSSTNPVFLSARTGAEAAAKELSQKHGIRIEIVWLTPPAEDGQVQAQRIAQAVNEGASAVLISCSDAGKVTGAIDDAVGRGAPVMTFDSDAPQSSRFAFYGVDDIKTGEAVMRELAPLMNGKAPVLLAQPTYNWGYVSVQKIVEKVHLKQDVPQIIPMELVRVSKENLGTWARQLKTWGFTDVPDVYLKMP